MRKLISISLAVFLLSSCGIVHRMDVEQGNIITPSMVHRLHTGMSKAQVREMMGTPVLINTFSDHRYDYIYTYMPGGGTMTEKSVTLTFSSNGILQSIKSNM